MRNFEIGTSLELQLGTGAVEELGRKFVALVLGMKVARLKIRRMIDLKSIAIDQMRNRIEKRPMKSRMMLGWLRIRMSFGPMSRIVVGWNIGCLVYRAVVRFFDRYASWRIGSCLVRFGIGRYRSGRRLKCIG